MKKRVFQNLDNSVFRILINTEDWSEGDILLMEQFGEPEINVGGPIPYLYGEELVAKDCKEKVFGDEYVRLLHGFPYARGFDSRDYESVDEARAVGTAWKETVLSRIDEAVSELRSNVSDFPTEEVSEI